VKRRQRGFTLVEAMVGVAIFTVLTLAMAGTFLVGYRAISNEARVIAADTAVSGATTTAGCPCTIQVGGPMTLTYGVPPVTVVYIVDAGRNLIRTVNGSPQVVARGMTSVTVSWAGCYGTVTIQPSATGASAVVLNVSNRPGGCI